MELSDRLRMNVSLVPEGARVADVGCDHGYASIWLVEQGIAGSCIALDVNEGPLARAREHVERAGLADRIDCRLSDGLAGLCPGEADTVMMAGMGGPLMIRILEEGKAALRESQVLVLQPQSELHEVRRYILEQGFSIDCEKACVEGGKYYFVLRAGRTAEGGRTVWDADWKYRYGTYLAEHGDPVLRGYLLKEREKYIDILTNRDIRRAESREEIDRRIHDIDCCLGAMGPGRQEK